MGKDLSENLPKQSVHDFLNRNWKFPTVYNKSDTWNFSDFLFGIFSGLLGIAEKNRIWRSEDVDRLRCRCYSLNLASRVAQIQAFGVAVSGFGFRRVWLGSMLYDIADQFPGLNSPLAGLGGEGEIWKLSITLTGGDCCCGNFCGE